MKKYYVLQWINCVINIIDMFLSLSSGSVKLLLFFRNLNSLKQILCCRLLAVFCLILLPMFRCHYRLSNQSDQSNDTVSLLFD